MAADRYQLALVAGLFNMLVLAGCSQPMPASIPMMDRAEERWNADPVPSYHIVVDVERPDDRRRNDLVVRQGKIVEATVRYWEGGMKRWGDRYELGQEQAFPFTVPGLFDMVRGELRGSNRADIRVLVGGEPAFPQRIPLGPVWEDNQPVSGTEATVIVRKFEILSDG